MFSFKNKEGVKKSNDLQESAKKVVAKTDERVFEHLLIDGEEPVRKLLPVEDNYEEVVNDGCYHQQQTIAVKVTNILNWFELQKVVKKLMKDKTFFGRTIYADDRLELVWVVQKTNNLDAMHWRIAIANYLNKRYGLSCTFADMNSKEWDYSESLVPWPIRYAKPITHVEYYIYEIGEQNAHAHSVFPDCKNEGKNNVSN